MAVSGSSPKGYVPFGGILKNPELRIGRPPTHRGRLGRLVEAKPADRLFGLRQLEVNYEQESKTLWTFMKPDQRPSYNPDMLDDFRAWQDGIQANFAGGAEEISYLVLGSRFPGVFSLGGDLRLFAEKIRRKDHAALLRYGNSCVQILHRNMNALGMPMITIALVQGDALGGGLESLLSFDIVVAERGAKFGFPEILFGLFPGMGAHSFLARRLGSSKAQELITAGKTYTTEQMHEFGLVHVIAEKGRGEEAVREYISHNRRRESGLRAAYQAAREVDRISLTELKRIVAIWADAALKLREQDLRLMERLVAAQDRLWAHAAPA
jgi:DSF synthase